MDITERQATDHRADQGTDRANAKKISDDLDQPSARRSGGSGD